MKQADYENSVVELNTVVTLFPRVSVTVSPVAWPDAKGLQRVKKLQVAIHRPNKQDITFLWTSWNAPIVWKLRNEVARQLDY